MLRRMGILQEGWYGGDGGVHRFMLSVLATVLGVADWTKCETWRSQAKLEILLLDCYVN